jgi:hypothetical protein
MQIRNGRFAHLQFPTFIGALYSDEDAPGDSQQRLAHQAAPRTSLQAGLASPRRISGRTFTHTGDWERR